MEWVSLFVASNGWVNNFMCDNSSSLHRKTTTAQQDPERLIDKLILYILHARRFSIKYKCSHSSIIAKHPYRMAWYLTLEYMSKDRNLFV